MIITVSGLPGAGKTTLTRMIAERLGYKHYSIGDLRGEMARRENMTIDEFNKKGESDFSTDHPVDEYQKRLGEEEDDFVIDGRLSFYFIPNAIKVFLKVDPLTGAKRIFRDASNRSDEKRYESVEEVLSAVEKRMESDRKRYMKYYGIDPFNEEHYDIVIDTTEMTPEEAVDEVMEGINEMINNLEEE